MNILNSNNKTLLNLLVSMRKLIYWCLCVFDKITMQKTKIFILSYHSFSNDDWLYTTPFTEFKKQISYLKKSGYSIVSLETIEKFIKNEIVITNPSVVITIDDGYKDNLDIVNYLEENKIPATLFILSNGSSINREEVATNKELMSTQEIKKLIKSGWTIGSHSATHANLSSLNKSNLKKEIYDSKTNIQNQFGLKVNYFAYPRGKYNTNVIETIKAAGFTMSLTMDDGTITSKSDLFTLPRIGVNRTHSINEFKTIFSPTVIKFRDFIKGRSV